MNSYLILSYNNLDELTHEVNRKWREGWRPQGGLSVLPGEVGLVFLQAITRPDENPTVNLSPTRKLPEKRDSGRVAAV
jgi:hypothetical protein